jgi:hypothetical protein
MGDAGWQVFVWGAGLVIAWTGFLVGIIRVLISRMVGNLEKQWQQTDADLKKLMIELPMHYQRRDDAIREYTAINTKLDKLYELILRKLKNE